MEYGKLATPSSRYRLVFYVFPLSYFLILFLLLSLLSSSPFLPSLLLSPVLSLIVIRFVHNCQDRIPEVQSAALRCVTKMVANLCPAAHDLEKLLSRLVKVRNVVPFSLLIIAASSCCKRTRLFVMLQVRLWVRF